MFEVFVATCPEDVKEFRGRELPEAFGTKTRQEALMGDLPGFLCISSPGEVYQTLERAASGKLAGVRDVIPKHQSCWSSVSALDVSALLGVSSMLSFVTTPSSTSME